MNGPGKSDRLIVPVKVPNNAAIAAAEVLEGRGLREGNAASKTRPGLRAGQGALSALVRMRRIAGVRGSTPSLKRGAQCGSSARWDLCGGRAEPSKRRPVPTATTTHPHALSLAALAARAPETAPHLRSLKVAARLREGWEAAIGARRTPSALLDAHGRVIASRGIRDLPTRLKIGGAADGTVALPDGRVGELEPLDGGGAIVWLRRRSRPPAPRLRLHLLGHGASAQLGTGQARASAALAGVARGARDAPRGDDAEQLALAVYGERGKAVTIRAQIHRVRTYLGRRAVQTNPRGAGTQRRLAARPGSLGGSPRR